MARVSMCLVFALLGCSGGTTSTSDSGTDTGTTMDSSMAGMDASMMMDTSTGMDAAMETSVPWTPSQLGSALVLWLDANKGVTQQQGKVSAWADQSPAANNAIQNTPQLQPSQVLNVVNQLPVVRFDGTNPMYLKVADASSLQWSTGDFTIEALVAWTNTPANNQTNGYGCIWAKPGANNPFPGASLFGKDPTVPNGSLRVQVASNVSVNSGTTAYNDGKFHYVGIRRAGTTLEARVDGTVKTYMNASVQSTDVSAPGVSVFIGGREEIAARQLLKGDIAEIIGVKGTISDNDLGTLESYFKMKYKL